MKSINTALFFSFLASFDTNNAERWMETGPASDIQSGWLLVRSGKVILTARGNEPDRAVSRWHLFDVHGSRIWKKVSVEFVNIVNVDKGKHAEKGIGELQFLQCKEAFCRFLGISKLSQKPMQTGLLLEYVFQNGLKSQNSIIFFFVVSKIEIAQM